MKTISITQLLCSIALIAIAIPIQAQDLTPTSEEQFMLELINRARANPEIEGIRLAEISDPAIQSAYRFFGVDLEQMKQDFATYPPRAPLAMNTLLTSAARRHSADMRDNAFQGHTGSDGSGLDTRIDDTGYPWRGIAENVYAYAESVEHGHAGFVADWGVETLGHRRNTLEFDRDPLYTEVGIGILHTNDTNGLFQAKRDASKHPIHSVGNTLYQANEVGPMLVTIDFAVPFDYTAQVLGVVYNDNNGNGFYDIGEGLGGIELQVLETGTSVTTPASGGYAIPIAQTGTFTIEASGPGIEQNIQQTFEINRENVKVDFNLQGDVAVDDWMMY